MTSSYKCKSSSVLFISPVNEKSVKRTEYTIFIPNFHTFIVYIKTIYVYSFPLYVQYIFVIKHYADLYNAAADSVIRLQNTTSRLKLYLKTLSESRKKF